MSRHSNHCYLSPDDLQAFPELLAAPLGYCPQIDSDTRRILYALQEDMQNHRDTIDPEQNEDGWLAALFMAEILEDILNRKEETHGLPQSLTWLR